MAGSRTEGVVRSIGCVSLEISEYEISKKPLSVGGGGTLRLDGRLRLLLRTYGFVSVFFLYYARAL